MNTQNTLPWYARPSAFTVLGAALVMSAPGEYSLAVLAGWSPWVAWLMPVCVSVYAAVAAMFVDSRPKGAPGRGTAILGAAGALALALAAQVTAHLISAGYAQSSAWLVAAVSAVPPVVVAHIMHMVARAHGAVRAAQADAVEEPEATADSTPEPEAVEELVDAEPVHDGSRPAGLSVIRGGAGEPDTLPLEELEPVAKVPSPAKGGRTVEEIRAAVEELKATGQPVNGTTYAALVGVSARTARRDLQALAA
ncbi:hypothetical protein ACFOOM_32330 [Streptomyces echinoruber]|uniref:DUF2637 domain-containing protein n=1 Tax=Streptomyces echinoruber TaxID=68898 RepID=A0A918RWE4_9ACTN|nr:hypothetical protein [Streptomyces echinoruber]GHA13604.1 hypothetical protein GCM10010389_60550 [Streptomyces echinoruber]